MVTHHPKKIKTFSFLYSGESIFQHIVEMIPQLKTRTSAKSSTENAPDAGATSKKKSKKK
jgi:hypothetical protein